jgi:bifunctional non-homologous end joining protein LigD
MELAKYCQMAWLIILKGKIMTIKTLNRHKITLTHEEKLYFPKSHITKGDLIEYYQEIAPYLIPYSKDRALTMDRFPEGITGESFFQKNASDYFPSWIKLQKVPSKTGNHETTNYVVAQDAATLVYIANQGCITPHVWLSKIDHLNYPDTLIFDLDPAGEQVKNFKPIGDAALMIKELLEESGLSAWVMTTGSRGLHVRVPIKPKHTFDEVRAFAKTIAEKVISQNSKEYTLESRKEKRGKKLLIDIMRNGFGATAVIPYAVRARENAPVATPLEWKELDDSSLRSDSYTLKTIFDRLEKKGDVWKGIQRQARTLKI